MENALALGLLIVASTLWIEAHERRAAIGAVRASPAIRLIAKAGGWLLAALGLWIAAQPHGWERGIPIWLAWFSLAATFSLVFTALLPKKHWYVGGVSLGATVILGAAHFLGVSG